MSARFVAIKKQLLTQIHSGTVAIGAKVASENQLAQQHGVSRMTARKALTELVNEGYLLRVQGAGTFVADSRPLSSMLTIRSIDEEICERGQRYRSEVLTQKHSAASDSEAACLGLNEGDELCQLDVIHFADDVPVQLEQRLIHPHWAEQFMAQDFSRQTASQYLSRQAPLTQADHVVEAIVPDNKVSAALQIDQRQPCLLVTRRTYSSLGIVSYARLYHPGNRYRLGGHLDF